MQLLFGWCETGSKKKLPGSKSTKERKLELQTEKNFLGRWWNCGTVIILPPLMAAFPSEGIRSDRSSEQ